MLDPIGLPDHRWPEHGERPSPTSRGVVRFEAYEIAPRFWNASPGDDHLYCCRDDSLGQGYESCLTLQEAGSPIHRTRKKGPSKCRGPGDVVLADGSLDALQFAQPEVRLAQCSCGSGNWNVRNECLRFLGGNRCYRCDD